MIAGSLSGSVWESNPQRALFKPSTGFEDQGPHQRCKHSQVLVFQRKSVQPQGFAILLPQLPSVHRSISESPFAHLKAPSGTPKRSRPCRSARDRSGWRPAIPCPCSAARCGLDRSGRLLRPALAVDKEVFHQVRRDGLAQALDRFGAWLILHGLFKLDALNAPGS
jgi:hypothetical protein